LEDNIRMHCLLFVPTNAHIYIVQNYITNTPARFGASAPSSGRFDVAFAEAPKHVRAFVI